MDEKLSIDITFIYFKDSAPRTATATVAASEWDAAQRLSLDERLDYLYTICHLSHLRPDHYKVRKIDIKIRQCLRS